MAFPSGALNTGKPRTGREVSSVVPLLGDKQSRETWRWIWGSRIFFCVSRAAGRTVRVLIKLERVQLLNGAISIPAAMYCPRKFKFVKLQRSIVSRHTTNDSYLFGLRRHGVQSLPYCVR
jgi:hypothetical protein